MASAAAARSLLRSAPLRHAAKSLTAGATRRRPSHRVATPVLPRLLRSPVEMSCCVESLMPMHSATASALMTSMLSVSCRSWGWVSEAGNEDI